jgi:membrane protein implicated in regulation of membrane protease activity
MRVSGPLYESLPYAYIVIGVAAVAASFAWRAADWSTILAILGMAAIVGGLVLVLRRRDYRIRKRHYGADFGEEDG